MRTIALLLPLIALGCTAPLDLDEADDDATGEDAKADGLTASAKVVYLNFSGTTLRRGDCDDAPSNCSNMVLWDATVVPAFDARPYGARSTVINGIVADVRRYFAGLDIRFTTTRPASGDYRMVMIGGKSLDLLGVWVMGRSHLYCDGANGRAIAFVPPVFDARPSDFGILDPHTPFDPITGALLPDPSTQESHAQYAEIPRAIAHELGHTFGLQHTMGFSASNPGPPDIMCEQGECRGLASYSFHQPQMTIEPGQGDCGRPTQSSLNILRAHIGAVR